MSGATRQREDNTTPKQPWTAGLVGARGIGAVHAREILSAGCKTLLVSGRSADTATAEASRLARQPGQLIEPVASLEELVSHRPTFISICSPTILHADHCDALRPSDAFLLVEKPMLWLQDQRYGIVDTARRLFDAAQGRLAVNHPTGFLGDDFARASGWSGPLRSFEFRYRTQGSHRGEMIAVDLLPHALSLLLTLSAGVGVDFGPPSVHYLKYGENVWQMDVSIGQIRCLFDFSQYPGRAGSEMSFSVDGMNVDRHQKAIGDGFTVSLVFDGYQFVVPNPMSRSIQRAIEAARACTSIAGEIEYSLGIIQLMSDLLVQP